ncbi:MAG: putative lipopolysaccharide biosynthesis protein [Candidatus Jettenia ecosi]|uniref:Putative lipopolysaccharide biosynthesis protein n=1 Tax=Candidatus Jettenia ecosi TaxID=2494326 RepID=A0A533Q686_9BACT|nr:MAG: putative lipopolysaccharide biosynthesis protein [Candidatus Jettenia ecosi]
MFTQWFNPEPTFKGLSFAKELIRLGHEVEVLTGFPNYPGGKVYNGYKIRFLQREIMDGIPVLRVPLYPSHNNSGMQRIANYASFALSAATIGALLVKPADIMYVYHPPATVGLAATVIHLLRKIPFVYDVQDLWPDTLNATGMVNNRIVLGLIEKWCRLIYRQARRITVLSPGFKKILCERGVPNDKVEVIYNWCDENQIQITGRNDDLARDLGLSGRFNIIFAGTMGKAQALDAVLDAAGHISQRFPIIQFVFVGGGIDVVRLQKKAQDMELINVRFLPRKPMSEIGQILNLADVLLVHLKDDPLFEITIPSKTQTYMAVGRPILMGARGDAADLVDKANAGISCIPEDPKSIADSIERLFTLPRSQLDALGDNGRKYYDKELSLSAGVRRFQEIFTSVFRC